MSDEDYLVVSTRVKRKRRLKMSYNQSPQDKNIKLPCVRFSGNYLVDLGFAVGGYFNMHINDDNTITVSPVPVEQDEKPDQQEAPNT